MVTFTYTVTVDGKHTKLTSSPARRNIAAICIDIEQYKRDVATAAHLLVCTAVGLAGSVGVPVEKILTLKNPNET